MPGKSMNAPLKRISELATVFSGFHPKPTERKRSGPYLLLGGRNIKDGRLVTTEKDSYVDEIDRESFRRAIARPGDIVVSILFDRRKLYLYREDDPPAVANNSCAVIRAGEQSDYIASYLRTKEGERDFLDKARDATGGAFIPRLSIKDLAAIQIPILPVSQLALLGDARIEKASSTELENIKKELGRKNVEIERLRGENKKLAGFIGDRLRAVDEQLATNRLVSRIKHGETVKLEFKSSLRWNIRAKRVDREIENAVLKTIVAFCNTHGGELLIGVADDASIIGIALDKFQNEDKFQLHLRNLLMARIEPLVAELVKYEMVRIDGKTICHVTCKPSTSKDFWLEPDKKSQRFYVRVGPSSTELQPRTAVAYIREHFEGGRQ